MSRALSLGVMIGLAGFPACLCFAPPPLDQANQLTPEGNRAGWELLFDGETGKGWRYPSSGEFPGGFWKVESGFLRGAPVGNRATDLMTVGVYRNFDLRFDWKIERGGNSGLKYMVGSSQKPVFEGISPPGIEGSVVPGRDVQGIYQRPGIPTG